MALKETIARLQASREEHVAPDELVAKWQGEISRLYDRVSEWLAPYVQEGVTLRRTPKTVHEERTGSYDVERLDIEIGDETVRLDPVATVVIGAYGRVDMSVLGSSSPVLLVLVGDLDALHWSIVDPSRRSELKPLNSESFETTLNGLLEDYGPVAGPSM